MKQGSDVYGTFCYSLQIFYVFDDITINARNALDSVLWGARKRAEITDLLDADKWQWWSFENDEETKSLFNVETLLPKSIGKVFGDFCHY